MADNEEITRRDFVKQGVVGTAVLAGAASGAFAFASPPGDLAHSVVLELGGLFIPSRPGDPGYKDLEQYGITQYVLTSPLRPIQVAGQFQLKSLQDKVQEMGGPRIVEAFNNAAGQFFEGKNFLELNDSQKEQYLNFILEEGKIADAKLRSELVGFYRATREHVMDAYYKNYPEHEVKRNAQGEPILKPGDTHQITNPNTKTLVTGWDIAGFKGPMTWEEEEQRRALMKKILPHWYEGDLVKLTNPRPTPAAAIKTSDGRDYYDVIVLGGGTAGCIVAGRIAERGINPKTGDRLRVAVIEGGDDWTIRDPGIRPGYGYPIRRRMITNVLNEALGVEGEVSAAHWPWDYPNNLKLFGGMAMHYGGDVHFPEQDDFELYREASGVDWDLAKFGDAIEEIRELFHVTYAPVECWSKGDHMWAEAGRALGYHIQRSPIAYRNCLGTVHEDSPLGAFPRYDTKGTSLPWAYIGLNNGMKVIANAEVEKVLIEKVPGGRPVAIGAVYKDKSGTMHEVRAARVIVACSALGTPMLLYRSGYGPRDYLGDKLLVENDNVDRNMGGDGGGGAGFTLYFNEPVGPGELRGRGGPWASLKPRPWKECAITFSTGGGESYPQQQALGAYAPELGWKHKEFMRNGYGTSRILGLGAGIKGIPWSWRMRPDARLERVSLDAPRIDAALREAAVLANAWLEKLQIKPAMVQRRAPRPAATAFTRPSHHSGTARAGASRETSVCSSDFDCHDIEHLLFTSGASIPRTTFSGGMGPTAVGAAYAWRRMIANHFSRGCSTQGFA